MRPRTLFCPCYTVIPVLTVSVGVDSWFAREHNICVWELTVKPIETKIQYTIARLSSEDAEPFQPVTLGDSSHLAPRREKAFWMPPDTGLFFLKKTIKLQT